MEKAGTLGRRPFPHFTFTSNRVIKLVALVHKNQIERDKMSLTAALAQEQFFQEEAEIFQIPDLVIDPTVPVMKIISRHHSGRELLGAKNSVVDTAQRFSPRNTELHIFKYGGSLDGTQEEYFARGLQPADLHTLVALNMRHPRYSDGKPHASVWKTRQGFAFAMMAQFYACREKGNLISSEPSYWRSGLYLAGVR